MKNKYSLIIIICLLSLVSFSQRTLPLDKNFPIGREGEIFQKFMHYVNGDIKTLPNADNKLLAQIAELKQATGKITFIGVFKSRRLKANESVIVVEDENYGLWQGISVQFTNKDKSKIERIRFRIFPKPISKNKISEKFSGTVLIAKGRNVIYTKALGEASKRYGISNNLETKFNIASLGKMFTAVSIMQLKEQNALKISDTISRYVDNTWLPESISSQITIHQLLTHTSGLGNYFNKEFENHSKTNYRELEDFKSLVVKDTLQFRPGKGYSYSNIGVLLLGVIIEKISGVGYETYINENIYQPANMTNSGLFEMDQPVKNLAIGYSKTDNNIYGWENNFYKHVLKGGPAGGSYSTIYDIHNFILALKNEKLVNAESLKQLWTTHPNSKFGYCFEVRTYDNTKQVGHSGGAPGISAEVIYDINRDLISVVLSNYDSGQTSFMIRDLMNQVKF